MFARARVCVGGWGGEGRASVCVCVSVCVSVSVHVCLCVYLCVAPQARASSASTPLSLDQPRPAPRGLISLVLCRNERKWEKCHTETQTHTARARTHLRLRRDGRADMPRHHDCDVDMRRVRLELDVQRLSKTLHGKLGSRVGTVLAESQRE